MVLHPIYFINHDQVKDAVARVQAQFDPEDVKFIRYSVGTDSTDEETMFFNILLSDEASKEPFIGPVTRRIRELLYREVNPVENWGVIPWG